MTDHERLSQELHNRADSTGGHPISFDDVKRSATKMKWQQRAAAGGVAAVVLAIGVPVGINLANRDPKAEPPVTTQSPTPTPTPSETPTKTPQGGGTFELTLDGLTRGDRPQVSWIQGKTLHLYDGSTATLPRDDYYDAVAYRGGWLATRYEGDGTKLDRIDAEGSVTSSEWGGPTLAESVDGTEVAWQVGVKTDHSIVFGIPSGHSEDEPKVKVPEATSVDVAGFSGPGEVAYQNSYYETDGSQKHFVSVIDQAGNHHSFDGLLGIGGVSQETGKIAVQTSSSDDGSCWDVRDADNGEVAWQTCDYSLSSFSADGTFLIAYAAYQDGLGPRDFYLLDATTGKELVHYQGADDSGAFVSDVAWDGDSHDVVASVHQQGTWQLVRMNFAGDRQAASDPVSAEDVENPFRLLKRS